MLAEFVLLLRNEIGMETVGWLAWEDPFILSLDSEGLRRDREQSAAESRKRLAYVIPTLQLLLDHA